MQLPKTKPATLPAECFFRLRPHLRPRPLLYALLFLLSSCSSDVLEEDPRGFLNPDNAYASVEGLQAGVAELHRLSRGMRTSELISAGIEGDKAVTTLYATGTDLAWFVVPTQNFFTNYDLVNSTNIIVRNYWRLLYDIVNNANAILAALPEAEITEEQRARTEASARFFRAFAYRYLSHLWGDVPILLEAVDGPRFNFSRSPQEEVWQVMVTDLEFARANLPRENPGDGRLAAAAAEHLLAETLLSLGDTEGAIAAATRVVDDPQYELMRERFGNHTGQPGDVFWDLFRSENQNRTSGNKEAIWVWQMDFAELNGNPQNRLTRAWAPMYERLKDSEGNRAYVEADTLGRGVGFVKPTNYLDSLIWLSDFHNDLRNSGYNMQRRYVNNNPASPDFGQVIQPTVSDLDRAHFVFVKKAAMPEGYPQGYDRSGRVYNDFYAMRLAETYLLRAEAHLAAGDREAAAADINVVRSRSNANPVSAAAVDLDYLLDERARELVVEEPRRLTLVRTGTLVERVRRFNPVSGPSIQDYHRRWPIPQDDLDANIEVDLGQNPGY
jgi:hypothetical protein